ncbi:MAG: SRPBCC domain-containing protein, partial [Anderseniella sp.]
AKGNAKVTLDAEDGGTRLSYVADAQIGGKLAQMGARLVEGAAKSVADDFFARFSATLGAEPATVASEPVSQPAEVAMAPSSTMKWVIVGLAILAAVAGYVLLS